MKKILTLCCLGCCLVIVEASDHAKRDNIFSLVSMHANSFYIGDFKMHRFEHGAWGNVNYMKQSSDSLFLESSSIQSVMIQGGYDYSFKLNGAQNFLGFGIDYSHSWIDALSYLGNADLTSLMLYNVFVHKTHFYIHSSLKYIFATQDFALTSNIHSLLLNLEFGYKAKFGRFFYFQPLVNIGGGLMTRFLQYQEHYPVFSRIGGYMGVDFGGLVNGDFALGGFFDTDFFVDSHSSLARKNLRLLLKARTNIHINKNVRLFFGGKMSFFGESNVDYGASAGIRVLFGEEYIKPKVFPSNQRNIKDIQKDMIYQSNLSRQRVQERTHLKPKELISRYKMQDQRNSPSVQDEIKYANRQRMIRESAKWLNIQKNNQNYQNRNLPALQYRDFDNVKANYQRELERKYGK